MPLWWTSSGHHHRVGWARVDTGGEAGRTHGCAVAWGHRQALLFVVDLNASEIARVDPRDAARRTLGPIVDDGVIDQLPSLAAAPVGSALAYTSRQRYRDQSELWRLGRGHEPQRVRAVSGADTRMIPFWHPTSLTLGAHIVAADPPRSEIVAITPRGKEVRVLQSDEVAPPLAAAWSPSGRHLVFFQGDPPALVSLDLDGGELEPLDVVVEEAGTPRFSATDTVVIEGTGQVEVIRLSRGL